jgi:VanZ family protein
MQYLPTLARIAFWCSLAALTIASLVPVALLPPQAMNLWDKAQHALGFAWLAALGLASYPRSAPLLAGSLIAWGGAIELMQWGTGWRYGEWIDWLADGVGVAVAWLVWRALPARWTGRT